MITLGLLTLPILSLTFGLPPAVTWGCIAMILLTAAKRVEANRTLLPRSPEKWAVVWRRLWLDRDIPSHEEWVARKPAEERPG